MSPMDPLKALRDCMFTVFSNKPEALARGEGGSLSTWFQSHSELCIYVQSLVRLSSKFSKCDCLLKQEVKTLHLDVQKLSMSFNRTSEIM